MNERDLEQRHFTRPRKESIPSPGNVARFERPSLPFASVLSLAEAWRLIMNRAIDADMADEPARARAFADSAAVIEQCIVDERTAEPLRVSRVAIVRRFR